MPVIITRRWLGSLVVSALDSRLDGWFPAAAVSTAGDGWPSSGGQITSVLHQATQAHSASYSQRDGKWVPAKAAGE